MQICYPCLIYQPLFPFLEHSLRSPLETSASMFPLLHWKYSWTEWVSPPDCWEPCLGTLRTHPCLTSWIYVCRMSEWLNPHFISSSPQPMMLVFLYPLMQMRKLSLRQDEGLIPNPQFCLTPSLCSLDHTTLPPLTSFFSSRANILYLLKAIVLAWDRNKQHVKIMSKALHFSSQHVTKPLWELFTVVDCVTLCWVKA